MWKMQPNHANNACTLQLQQTVKKMVGECLLNQLFATWKKYALISDMLYTKWPNSTGYYCSKASLGSCNCHNTHEKDHHSNKYKKRKNLIAVSPSSITSPRSHLQTARPTFCSIIANEMKNLYIINTHMTHNIKSIITCKMDCVLHFRECPYSLQYTDRATQKLKARIDQHWRNSEKCFLNHSVSKHYTLSHNKCTDHISHCNLIYSMFNTKQSWL